MPTLPTFYPRPSVESAFIRVLFFYLAERLLKFQFVDALPQSAFYLFGAFAIDRGGTADRVANITGVGA